MLEAPCQEAGVVACHIHGHKGLCNATAFHAQVKDTWSVHSRTAPLSCCGLQNSSLAADRSRQCTDCSPQALPSLLPGTPQLRINRAYCDQHTASEHICILHSCPELRNPTNMQKPGVAGQGQNTHVGRIPLIGMNINEESIDSPYDRRSEVYRHLAYEHAREHQDTQKRQPICTVPNLLTFLRLILVPVVMLLWYMDTYPLAPFLTAVVFVTASLTDWLDGYIARQFEIATTFGAFLDPVADKVMVTTVLVLLSTAPPAPISQTQMAVPVIIICCREVTMSALREWAASAGGAAHKAVKVNSFGKWKTALQMTSMSLLLFCKDQTGMMEEVFQVARLTSLQVSFGSWLLLWGAAGLAAWSLSIYFANVWTHFVAPAKPQPEKKAQ